MKKDKNISQIEHIDAPKSEAEQKLLIKRKRIIAIVSIVICVALFLWLGWFLTDTILYSINTDGDILSTAKNFKALIESYGSLGWVVAFGIQVLQVIISPIPGEVVEVGMGLCFGWFWGLIMCLLGGAIAAWIIMLFVRKFGIKIVELFVSTDKINELKFINSNDKVKRTAALLYIIPGTPKDPLIFFFGLTRIKIWDFIWIQTLARIPSIITSTVVGEQAAEENFFVTIMIFVVTGILAIIGFFSYRRVLIRKREKEIAKENAINNNKDNVIDNNKDNVIDDNKDNA